MDWIHEQAKTESGQFLVMILYFGVAILIMTILYFISQSKLKK